MTTLVAVGVIAIAYMLPTRLGLALICAPSDLAMVWPASGVAAGIMIALPAVVIGVEVGAVTANLMSHRGLVTCLVNGSWNAGEVVLAARLLEQRAGRPFTSVGLRPLAGLLAAARFAAAAAGLRPPRR